jgi:hypothetical protein
MKCTLDLRLQKIRRIDIILQHCVIMCISGFLVGLVLVVFRFALYYKNNCMFWPNLPL